MRKSDSSASKLPSTLKKSVSMVKEGSSAYILRRKPVLKLVAKAQPSLILTGVSQKPENQLTAFEKMNIIKGGLSKKDLENLKEKTTLDYDKLAIALSVTRATLINKKGKEKFNISLSERIISLADIYSYGYEVFEDAATFNRWMFRSNKALGGEIPYHFMDNQFGREEVRNVIGRIDHGVIS